MDKQTSTSDIARDAASEARRKKREELEAQLRQLEEEEEKENPPVVTTKKRKKDTPSKISDNDNGDNSETSSNPRPKKRQKNQEQDQQKKDARPAKKETKRSNAAKKSPPQSPSKAKKRKREDGNISIEDASSSISTIIHRDHLPQWPHSPDCLGSMVKPFFENVILNNSMLHTLKLCHSNMVFKNIFGERAITRAQKIVNSYRQFQSMPISTKIISCIGECITHALNDESFTKMARDSYLLSNKSQSSNSFVRFGYERCEFEDTKGRRAIIKDLDENGNPVIHISSLLEKNIFLLSMLLEATVTSHVEYTASSFRLDNQAKTKRSTKRRNSTKKSKDTPSSGNIDKEIPSERQDDNLNTPKQNDFTVVLEEFRSMCKYQYPETPITSIDLETSSYPLIRIQDRTTVSPELLTSGRASVYYPTYIHSRFLVPILSDKEQFNVLVKSLTSIMGKEQMKPMELVSKYEKAYETLMTKRAATNSSNSLPPPQHIVIESEMVNYPFTISFLLQFVVQVIQEPRSTLHDLDVPFTDINKRKDPYVFSKGSSIKKTQTTNATNAQVELSRKISIRNQEASKCIASLPWRECLPGFEENELSSFLKELISTDPQNASRSDIIDTLAHASSKISIDTIFKKIGASQFPTNKNITYQECIAWLMDTCSITPLELDTTKSILKGLTSLCVLAPNEDDTAHQLFSQLFELAKCYHNAEKSAAKKVSELNTMIQTMSSSLHSKKIQGNASAVKKPLSYTQMDDIGQTFNDIKTINSASHQNSLFYEKNGAGRFATEQLFLSPLPIVYNTDEVDKAKSVQQNPFTTHKFSHSQWAILVNTNPASSPSVFSDSNGQGMSILHDVSFHGISINTSGPSSSIVPDIESASSTTLSSDNVTASSSSSSSVSNLPLPDPIPASSAPSSSTKQGEEETNIGVSILKPATSKRLINMYYQECRVLNKIYSTIGDMSHRIANTFFLSFSYFKEQVTKHSVNPKIRIATILLDTLITFCTLLLKKENDVLKNNERELMTINDQIKRDDAANKKNTNSSDMDIEDSNKDNETTEDSSVISKKTIRNGLVKTIFSTQNLIKEVTTCQETFITWMNSHEWDSIFGCTYALLYNIYEAPNPFEILCSMISFVSITRFNSSRKMAEFTKDMLATYVPYATQKLVPGLGNIASIPTFSNPSVRDTLQLKKEETEAAIDKFSAVDPNDKRTAKEAAFLNHLFMIPQDTKSKASVKSSPPNYLNSIRCQVIYPVNPSFKVILQNNTQDSLWKAYNGIFCNSIQERRKQGQSFMPTDFESQKITPEICDSREENVTEDVMAIKNSIYFIKKRCEFMKEYMPDISDSWITNKKKSKEKGDIATRDTTTTNTSTTTSSSTTISTIDPNYFSHSVSFVYMHPHDEGIPGFNTTKISADLRKNLPSNLEDLYSHSVPHSFVMHFLSCILASDRPHTFKFAIKEPTDEEGKTDNSTTASNTTTTSTTTTTTMNISDNPIVPSDPKVSNVSTVTDDDMAIDTSENVENEPAETNTAAEEEEKEEEKSEDVVKEPPLKRAKIDNPPLPPPLVKKTSAESIFQYMVAEKDDEEAGVIAGDTIAILDLQKEMRNIFTKVYQIPTHGGTNKRDKIQQRRTEAFEKESSLAYYSSLIPAITRRSQERMNQSISHIFKEKKKYIPDELSQFFSKESGLIPKDNVHPRQGHFRYDFCPLQKVQDLCNNILLHFSNDPNKYYEQRNSIFAENKNESFHMVLFSKPSSKKNKSTSEKSNDDDGDNSEDDGNKKAEKTEAIDSEGSNKRKKLLEQTGSYFKTTLQVTRMTETLLLQFLNTSDKKHKTATATTTDKGNKQKPLKIHDTTERIKDIEDNIVKTILPKQLEIIKILLCLYIHETFLSGITKMEMPPNMLPKKIAKFLGLSDEIRDKIRLPPVFQFLIDSNSVEKNDNTGKRGKSSSSSRDTSNLHNISFEKDDILKSFLSGLKFQSDILRIRPRFYPFVIMYHSSKTWLPVSKIYNESTFQRTSKVQNKDVTLLNSIAKTILKYDETNTKLLVRQVLETERKSLKSLDTSFRASTTNQGKKDIQKDASYLFVQISHELYDLRRFVGNSVQHIWRELKRMIQDDLYLHIQTFLNETYHFDMFSEKNGTQNMQDIAVYFSKMIYAKTLAQFGKNSKLLAELNFLESPCLSVADGDVVDSIISNSKDHKKERRVSIVIDNHENDSKEGDEPIHHSSYSPPIDHISSLRMAWFPFAIAAPGVLAEEQFLFAKAASILVSFFFSRCSITEIQQQYKNQTGEPMDIFNEGKLENFATLIWIRAKSHNHKSSSSVGEAKSINLIYAPLNFASLKEIPRFTDMGIKAPLTSFQRDETTLDSNPEARRVICTLGSMYDLFYKEKLSHWISDKNLKKCAMKNTDENRGKFSIRENHKTFVWKGTSMKSPSILDSVWMANAYHRVMGYIMAIPSLNWKFISTMKPEQYILLTASEIFKEMEGISVVDDKSIRDEQMKYYKKKAGTKSPESSMDGSNNNDVEDEEPSIQSENSKHNRNEAIKSYQFLNTVEKVIVFQCVMKTIYYMVYLGDMLIPLPKDKSKKTKASPKGNKEEKKREEPTKKKKRERPSSKTVRNVPVGGSVDYHSLSLSSMNGENETVTDCIIVRCCALVCNSLLTPKVQEEDLQKEKKTKKKDKKDGKDKKKDKKHKKKDKKQDCKEKKED